MRHVILETLEDEDYEAKGAANVEEALKIAEKHRFDLVITDVRMPGTEDGVQGFGLLKRKFPNLKCIVITGYADHPPKVLAVELQVSDYIQKPFPLDELLKSVDRVVNEKKWALFYSNTIQKGPLRVLSGLFRSLKKDKSAELSAVRGQLFQTFYLSVRCDKERPHAQNTPTELLTRDTANGLFYQMDKCDVRYKAYLDDPDDKTADALIKEYSELLERLSAFVRCQAPMLDSGRFERTAFNSLYKALQAGKVTPQELELAPALHGLSQFELDSSPELAKLKTKLWG